jgi:hypothetical protein
MDFIAEKDCNITLAAAPPCFSAALRWQAWH